MKCGGSQICEHKRQRQKCVNCGGSQICEHKRQRYQCVDCGGSQICVHKRRRARCIECGGSDICEHKRRRERCVQCEGSGICEHKRHRFACVECEGPGICEHKRLRNQCVDCKPLDHINNSEYFCKCMNRKKPQMMFCKTCANGFSQRIEHTIGEVFKAANLIPSLDAYNMIGNTCSGERKMFADFVFCSPTLVVVVEVDEEKGHSNRDVSCELSRALDIPFSLNEFHEDGMKRPVVVIRFSPDKDVGDDGCPLENRLLNLIVLIRFLLDTKDGDQFFELTLTKERPCYIFIGYGLAAAKHISALKQTAPLIDVKNLKIFEQDKRMFEYLSKSNEDIKAAIEQRSERFLNRVLCVLKEGESQCIAIHRNNTGRCIEISQTGCFLKHCKKHCEIYCSAEECESYKMLLEEGKGRCNKDKCNNPKKRSCKNDHCVRHCKKVCANGSCVSRKRLREEENTTNTETFV